ncbi:MAG: hypothetical protein NC916_02440, partial [Candidatus Omnitrophica bacterium]|nr:hypothetical protein [Candidatus Omnitrophota bacterium]
MGESYQKILNEIEFDFSSPKPEESEKKTFFRLKTKPLTEIETEKPLKSYSDVLENIEFDFKPSAVSAATGAWDEQKAYKIIVDDTKNILRKALNLASATTYLPSSYFYLFNTVLKDEVLRMVREGKIKLPPRTIDAIQKASDEDIKINPQLRMPLRELPKTFKSAQEKGFKAEAKEEFERRFNPPLNIEIKTGEAKKGIPLVLRVPLGISQKDIIEEMKKPTESGESRFQKIHRELLEDSLNVALQGLRGKDVYIKSLAGGKEGALKSPFLYTTLSEQYIKGTPEHKIAFLTGYAAELLAPSPVGNLPYKSLKYISKLPIGQKVLTEIAKKPLGSFVLRIADILPEDMKKVRSILAQAEGK